MKNIIRNMTLILAATTVVACKSHHEVVTAASAEVSEAKPLGGQTIASEIPATRVFIYKTAADYSQNVPVIMDSSRSTIVSYPAPQDLQTGGKYATPTKLEKGYWLDNRGIGPTVAFLSYTYEEYAKMEKAPSVEELMNHIIDRNPLTEFHFCKKRNEYKDIVGELNQSILDGSLLNGSPTVCPEETETTTEP